MAPAGHSGRRGLVVALAGAFAVAAASGGFLVTRPRDADTLSAAGASVATTTAAPASTAAPSTAPPTTRGPLGSGEAVTLAFAGDINFEGVNRARLDADPASVLEPIAPVLRAADVAVGNLETTLGTAGSPWPGKEFTFRAPGSAIDALRAVGLDAVSMANNHGMDYGAAGLTASLEIARAQPDHFVIGIGGDEAEAYRPFVTEVRGQRIAVIGATQVIGDSMIPTWTATASQPGLASAKRVDRLVAEVQQARADADTVVVFLHWGIELETCPSGDQKALAEALVAAGADVIVGGHAHRVQGAGRLGEALVGYGLGNFLWNASSAESATTGVLEVTVTGRRVDSYRWVPARIHSGVPRALEGADATAAVATWDARRGCTGLAP
jgi:poly-gamma-glutamate synthesis protein (capsule biosynthesis protein)